MSDAEYDALRKDFIEKYGTKELNYVPSDEVNGFTKRKHDFAMMSLNKIKIREKKSKGFLRNSIIVL